LSQFKSSIQAKFLRVFRKRELYLRSDGHIHYIALEPFKLMIGAGLAIAVLILGITGGVSYLLAGNTVTTLRENLNRNLETKNSTANLLIDQKKKYEDDLEKLRADYELQLARFQSSLAQVNGRLTKNQNAYLKELERLRTAKSAPKPETAVPEK